MNTKNYETIELSNKDNLAIRFLYNTFIGRLILRILINKPVSNIVGFLMNTKVSRIFIPGFIKKNKIALNEYVESDYKTFNSFFKREIKKEYRSISNRKIDLIAPCDGKLISYNITEQSTFKIKNSIYDIKSLLQNQTLAQEFKNGTILIFRLTPDNYHRYCFIDDGQIISSKTIKGVLHTVRPIALNRYKVYIENTREYTVLKTENFKKVVQMEVGALFVGRITNYKTKGKIQRGEEKGTFEFGGSTIVMLFKENTVEIDKRILKNTKEGKETIIKMGDIIGTKYK